VSGSDKRLRKKENARAAREAREAAVKRARRNRLLIRFAVLVAVFAIVVGVVSVINRDDEAETTTSDPTNVRTDDCVGTVPEPNPASQQTWETAPTMTIDVDKSYVAAVSTSCGEFEIELDAENAPNTVNSFVFLANEGYYDGLTFHRLVDGFVIQGGDPEGDGTGGPGYTTPDEPPPAGYGEGSVAMANGGPGTSGSQFFVVLTNDGGEGLGGPPYAYSTLGTVSSGLDVVERLGSFVNPGEDPNDISTQVPTRDLYIFSVEIDES